MKKHIIATSFALAAASQALASGQIITPRSAMQFQPAPAEYFSGRAEFARYPAIPGSPDAAAIVHFEPGTITNWHTHSRGQYLIVTEGEGRTQEWGKPVQIIRKGDVVWCPPGVKHWHGAGEHTAMSHVAISPQAADNKPTWLERVDLPPSGKPDASQHRQTTPLTARQLAIVPIAALSATGDLERLGPAIAAGLDQGLTISEIREIFAHQYAYAGFPRALNGLNTLQNVLKERQARGIRDPQGNAPTALADPDYYQLGRQTLKTLGSSAADTVIAGFDGIDHALKAHLFGYLFHRDNLSYVNRQLVTVSTLSALGNVNAQLASHLKNTQNLGISPDDLRRVFDVLEKEVSPAVAANALTVLNANR